MTLSQQLREAGEKATPGAWEYNDPAKYTQGHGKFSEVAVYAEGRAFPWRMLEISAPDDEQAIATAHLIVLLRNNLDTIIAALEAQEAGK